MIKTQEAAAVQLFLDKVDQVLNSNTLILTFQANFQDLALAKRDVTQFLKAPDFKDRLFSAALERGWSNFYYCDNNNNQLKPIPNFRFVKYEFDLEWELLTRRKGAPYLRLMLMGNDVERIFMSPYQKGLSKEEAVPIVRDFLNTLIDKQQYKLLKLDINFAYSIAEIRQKRWQTYFCDGIAANTATLLIREDNSAFLILTNGTD